VFRKNLKLAINSSEKYRDDVWGLSVDAGLGRKTLYNILRDERLDVSKTGPGIFGMSRVAELLGVSLDGLVGCAILQSGSRSASGDVMPLSRHVVEALSGQEAVGSLSADALLRMHAKSGQRIEAFAQWMDRCDQYFLPAEGDAGIRVKEVGETSLAAITMGSPDKALLQSALDAVDDTGLRQSWLADYSEACQRGSLTTVESLDVQMPNHPVRVKMDFVRCLLHVSGADDDQAILNFSLLIV